jgi:hypothetical protein
VDGLADPLQSENSIAPASKPKAESVSNDTEEEALDVEFGFHDDDLAFLEQRLEDRNFEHDMPKSHSATPAINQRAAKSANTEEPSENKASGNSAGTRDADDSDQEELDAHSRPENHVSRYFRLKDMLTTGRGNDEPKESQSGVKFASKPSPIQGASAQPETEQDSSSTGSDIRLLRSTMNDCKSFCPVLAQQGHERCPKIIPPKLNRKERQSPATQGQGIGKEADQQPSIYGIDPSFYDEFKDFVEFI